ncbi:RNA-directed DNA polymerase [Myxococcus hansupus]|uniref:RNA-directed DNA polymerase n=1 Tax=Pseudomyxococcus hansupus TaxID=1297742 RepID=UPI0009E4C8A4|nr:RNA-directed DNA polymerase [Myxococcus hansupus]
MSMDNLSIESLEWALKHLEVQGDTDFLPRPFEIKAMRASWSAAMPEFQKVNLAEHSPSTPLLVLAPKGDAAFRAIKQLNPWDSIIYAAIAREAAEAIETMRHPQADGRVFSYRVSLTDNGQLFDPAVTWRGFHRRSREIVKEKNFSHVVVADIADFYNHIYLHRVRNALESAGVNSNRAKNIERFLMGLNAKNSRGLPIGPNASRLLAEAALNDVDSMLVRRGYTHVRYLDDFRIFVNSRSEATQALHDLAYYLYTAHRLALQSKKTAILSAMEFHDKELFDTAEMAEAMEAMQLTSAASMNPSATKNMGSKTEALAKTLTDLLSRALDNSWTVRVYDVGWIYRVAAEKRIRALVPKTLSSLEKLATVLPDVINFLLRVTNEKNAEEIGSALVNFATGGEKSSLPFVQIWVLHALCERPELCEAGRAMSLANRAPPVFRDRALSLLAQAHARSDYIREQKEVAGNMGPWAQRAVVWAASVLPGDEARHWLEPLKRSHDPMLAAVAKAVA